MDKKILEEINRYRSIVGLDILNEINIKGRTSVSEFNKDEADSVDGLLKLMSEYTPKDGWFVSIGYLNNTKIPVKVAPSDELNKMAADLNDDDINSIINSPEYRSGKMKHPHAGRRVKGEELPSTIYKLKIFTCNWLSEKARKKLKSEKDANIMAAYTSRGLTPHEIKIDNKQGLGWSSIQDTPFDKHDKSGTQRFVMYRKRGCFIDTSKYFIYKNNKIELLSKEKANFYFKLSNTNNSYKIPKEIANIEDETARNEILKIDSLYEFKNLDLNKIPFLTCTCDVDGKHVKLFYINYNTVPDGLEKGRFKDIIKAEIKNLK